MKQATVLALALALAGCGDGGGSGGGGGSAGGGGTMFCGNGKVEGREDCDPPNPAQMCGPNCKFFVSMPTRLSVTAKVNGALAMTRSGFDGDDCGEVVSTGRTGYVKLEVAGPTSMTMEVTCSAATGKLIDVTAGQYTVTATLTEDNGAGGRTMLAPPVSKTVDAAANVDTTVDLGFPYDSFATVRQGSLKFRVEKLGGATSCAMAATPVTKQRLKLLDRAGAVVAARTADAMAGGMSLPGQATDGVAEAACHTPVGPDDLQRLAALVDWGPYDLVVELRDDAGMTRYCKRYPVFVGAGQENYIFRFDVPAGACLQP